MSCSRRCDFFKAEDAQWYMTLGNHEYAYDDCDCTTYGPFVTEVAAQTYLFNNFSNPGSSSTDCSGSEPVPENVVAPRRSFGLYDSLVR